MSHATITLPNGIVVALGIFGFLLTIDSIIDAVIKSKPFFRPALCYLTYGVLGFVGSLIVFSFVTLLHVSINLSLDDMSMLGIGAGIGGGYFPTYFRDVGAANRNLVYNVPVIIRKIDEINKLKTQKAKVLANYDSCEIRLKKAKVDLQEAEKRIRNAKRISAAMLRAELKAKDDIGNETGTKKRFKRRILEIDKEISKSEKEKDSMVNEWLASERLIENNDRAGDTILFRRFVITVLLLIILATLLFLAFHLVAVAIFIVVIIPLYFIGRTLILYNSLIARIAIRLDDSKSGIPYVSLKAFVCMFVLAFLLQIITPIFFGSIIQLFYICLIYGIAAGLAGMFSGGIKAISDKVNREFILCIGIILTISSIIIGNFHLLGVS